ICSVIVLVVVMLLGVSFVNTASRTIKEKRAQLKQAASMMSDPMFMQQYGPQVEAIKDDLKPMGIVMAYTQSGFFFIIAIVLLAFIWGTADLFMAARQIEYNTRRPGELEEAAALPEKEKAAAAE
ncbi:MAG: hypothetical protein ACYC6A_09725, partial [Armatimonadota bacterium]